MKNIQELRNELADNFKRLKEGEAEVKDVAEMNNTAGKMIQTVMLELKQAELTDSKERIPFLGYEGKELGAQNTPQLTN